MIVCLVFVMCGVLNWVGVLVGLVWVVGIGCVGGVVGDGWLEMYGGRIVWSSWVVSMVCRCVWCILCVDVCGAYCVVYVCGAFCV